MKIFLDSADIEEIKQAPFIQRITTNPSLMSGKSQVEVYQEIYDYINVPTSLEVTSNSFEEMVKEAKELNSLAGNVVIKLPCTPTGLKAAQRIKGDLGVNVSLNITLVFSTNQAILVANLGASYVSPFIGRLNDLGQDGFELIREIVQVYKNYDKPPQIIAASIRSPRDVTQAALSGVDIATVPFKVYQQMFEHPLTDKGLEQFMKDAKPTKQGV